MPGPATISLVTTCFNAAALLPVTLGSIRQQTLLRNPEANFQYIVIDAASTDGSAELIREAAAELPLTLVSEPDGGVYEGLAKGLARCTGDVIGYLNAGDFLFPTALEVLRDAFTDTPAKWMTGYCTLANARWQPCRIDLPFRYRKRFFQSGIHGTALPTLQQESTFWRREMMERFDWETFGKLKLAGDFMLWQHFGEIEPPAILHSLVGAFCAHPGQLSADNGAYLAELKSLCRAPSPIDFVLAKLDRFFWNCPEGLKRRLGGGRHIVHDGKTSTYILR